MFNLDDSEPLSQSLLGVDDVRAAVQTLAVEAGQLSVKADLAIPDAATELEAPDVGSQD